MAGVRISIDLQESELARAIGRVQELDGEGADLMLRDMGEYLLGSTQDRFDAEVAPDGTPWAPLSSRYKKRKDRERPGAKKLVYDNFLKASLRYQVDAGELLLGSNREYAAIHQLGGQIKRAPRSTMVYFRRDRRTGEVGNRFVPKRRSNFGQWASIPGYTINIPARPWLGLSSADRQELLRIAADHLGGALED